MSDVTTIYILSDFYTSTNIMNSIILAVGRSTIKCTCRKNGIVRWPSTEKQRETTQDHTNTESNQHLDDKGEISKCSFMCKTSFCFGLERSTHN